MSDVLKPKERAFVDEYMHDRNAAAAAQRAGFSPRTANRLLATPAIAAAIADKQRAVATDARLSTATLLAEAEEAYRVAAAAGNASAMCAVVQLKARLSGLLDVEPPAESVEQPPADARTTARAMLAWLAEEGEAAVQIGFADKSRGEVLVRTTNPDLMAAAAGAEPARKLDEMVTPPPVPDFRPNELPRRRRPEIRLGYAHVKQAQGKA